MVKEISPLKFWRVEIDSWINILTNLKGLQLYKHTRIVVLMSKSIWVFASKLCFHNLEVGNMDMESSFTISQDAFIDAMH